MNEQGTTITNIEIPFGRMVMIILKMMLASIPAVILFYLIMLIPMMLFAGVFGGLGAFLSTLP